MNPTTQNIIFFDGFCHLCNAFVDWMILQDAKSAKRQFSFAALQGKTADQKLPSEIRNSLESVIVVTPDGRILKKAEAVLYCFSKISFLSEFVKIAKLIPPVVQDGLYNFIAKKRYSLFGKKDFCRFPTPEEQDYLLP